MGLTILNAASLLVFVSSKSLFSGILSIDYLAQTCNTLRYDRQLFSVMSLLHETFEFRFQFKFLSSNRYAEFNFSLLVVSAD